MGFRFAQYELIEKPLELWRDGERLAVPKRLLETLCYLLQRRDTIVTKQDLIDHVWQGRIVTDAAIAKRIEKVREAIGECGKNPKFIQTIYGRGFSFEGDVTVTGAATVADSDRALALTEHVDWIGKSPVIAVPSFSSCGLLSNMTLLADGLATDIITALAGLSTLRVIARGSSFQFDCRCTSPRKLRTLLGADYVLSGDVRSSGAGFVIAVELAETRDETIVWAERYEIAEEEIHLVRETIVSRIVSQTEMAVPETEAARLHLHEPYDMTAWEAFHVGTRLLHARGDANMARAERYFERAVQIDPNFARAHAGLTEALVWRTVQHPKDIDAEYMRRVMQSAENGMRADPNDAACNLFMGRALYCASQLEGALSWFQKGVGLSPSYALAHFHLASFFAFSEQKEKALEHGKQSLVLSPQDVLRFSIYAALWVACFEDDDFEQSIMWGKKAAEAPFDDVLLLGVGLAAHHQAGDIAEAEKMAERMRCAFPDATIDSIVAARPMASDRFRQRGEKLLEAYGFG